MSGAGWARWGRWQAGKIKKQEDQARPGPARPGRVKLGLGGVVWYLWLSLRSFVSINSLEKEMWCAGIRGVVGVWLAPPRTEQYGEGFIGRQVAEDGVGVRGMNREETRMVGYVGSVVVAADTVAMANVVVVVEEGRRKEGGEREMTDYDRCARTLTHIHTY